MTRAIRAIGAFAIFTAGCGTSSEPLILSAGYVDEGGPGFEQSDGGAQGGTLGVAVSPSKVTLCAGECVTLSPTASAGTPPYSYAWDQGLMGNGPARACPTKTTTYTVTATDSSGQTSGELTTPNATGTRKVTVVVAPCSEAGVPLEAGGDAGPGLHFTQDIVAPWTGITVGVREGTTVYWANWTSMGTGTVAGVLMPPSGAVQVTYNGELYGAQTTVGSNFYSPTATFVSATVPDPPPGPGIVEISGGQVDSLAFSPPVTNPLVAIVSLGTGYLTQVVTLDFSAPVTVLSYGADTYDPVAGTLTVADGGTGVSAVEGSGVVEVEGTF
jgi:hypothetical protein